MDGGSAGAAAAIDPGLEGVVAAETELSHVFGEEGRLVVRGFDVEDLVERFGFEETAALLWRDLAPENADGAAIVRDLGGARLEVGRMLPAFLDAVEGLSPVEALRAGLAMLHDARGGEIDARDHVLVTAAIPVFAAAIARAGRGLQPVQPDAALRQVPDFLRMLKDADPEPAHVKALETYLVTVADHGFNASTFTARVVASTRAGVISSVVAALCALKGPLHGGAPGPVLDMFDEIGSEDGIRPWIARQFDEGGRIMGFGHRVYRARDPRADVLKNVAAALKDSANKIPFAERVEAGVLAALAERHPGRRLETNVEFYTALALDAVGLPRDMFTPAFAMGRVLGWTAHAYEQLGTGRLVRPQSRYVGPMP